MDEQVKRHMGGYGQLYISIYVYINSEKKIDNEIDRKIDRLLFIIYI